jgi:hypothetical protein
MELTPITILALAGVGLIIIAIVDGGFEVKEIRIPPLSNRIRIMSAIAGAGLLAAAIYLYSPPAPLHPPELPKATIDYPATSTEIPLKIQLRGTVTPAVPNRGTYWIVIRDDDGDYYPQAKITALRNGIWTHPLAFGPAWKARPVWVLVVFARDEQANDALLGSVGSEGLSGLPNNIIALTTLELRVQP